MILLVFNILFVLVLLNVVNEVVGVVGIRVFGLLLYVILFVSIDVDVKFGSVSSVIVVVNKICFILKFLKSENSEKI